MEEQQKEKLKIIIRHLIELIPYAQTAKDYQFERMVDDLAREIIELSTEPTP